MGREIGRLSALKVARLVKPGMYSDGGGLYLQVTGDGGKNVAKSWIFQFKVQGRERQMGLGPLRTITLAEARTKATECRKLRLEGIDPIEARHASRDQVRIESAKAMTFKACAEGFIEAHRASWRNAKHGDQWCNTLATYAYPFIGALPVQQIDVGLVTKVLGPIWTTKTVTASRVRGRIESVLDWARARGYRQGENPARWRGHLQSLLPKPSKVARVEHHAALPYTEIGAFLTLLQTQEGIAARALEFAILTAARAGEVIGATWTEIDMDAKTWTIAAKRMKGGREHRVPLSPAALAVVETMKATRQGDYLFPGQRTGRSLSVTAMSSLLDRMTHGGATAHGFRSTFRVWAAECTNIAREVAEQALAHSLSDRVEAAYQRSDLFEKRRKLMEAWGGYCARPATAGKVVPIRWAEA